MKLISIAVVVVSVAAAGSAAAAAPRVELRWSPCAEVLPDWDGNHRTECAVVPVPLDRQQPSGRKLDLVLSRVPARSPQHRRGVVVTNPGGPGISGLKLPEALASSTVAGIGEEYDLIGFAPRGTGPSGGKACAYAPGDGPAADPSVSRRRQFEQQYEREGRRNARCVGADPEFFESLSTNVIADDLDSIRAALGEDKISYYGISWGTALGAVYRSKYDARVDRMLLDSVMPPRFALDLVNEGQAAAKERNLRRFSAWLAERDGQYHFGTTGREVLDHLRALLAEKGERVRGLLAAPQRYWAEAAAGLREVQHSDRATTAASAPPTLVDDHGEFNQVQEQAVLCNDAGEDPGLLEAWHAAVRLRRDYPVFGAAAKYENRCVDWPLPQQRWELRRGESRLQLVGHSNESTTPYAWAERMRARIGGSLLTVTDDLHGSLSTLPCGSTAVEFFRTGRTSTGICPAQ